MGSLEDIQTIKSQTNRGTGSEMDHVENVLCIMTGCSTLALKDYKRKHDELCLNIHWALCKKYFSKSMLKVLRW